MTWHNDPDHPFAGITEKLKRADQNIVNLKTQIDRFLKRGKYPVLPHPDHKLWQEAVDYHRSKRIPLLFGVLAGEIIHHLRSALDHVVWHFSDPVLRENLANVIEFPVFRKKPIQEKEVERYKRKIQAITNKNVLGLIEELQPYNAGAEVEDFPLLIVHDMDRFDKHRELVIVDSSALINFSANLPNVKIIAAKVALYTQGKLPVSEHHIATYAIKNYAVVTPHVAFRQFGKREGKPMLLGLKELFDDIAVIVEGFASLV
jgi:hypothetical protein